MMMRSEFGVSRDDFSVSRDDFSVSHERINCLGKFSFQKLYGISRMLNYLMLIITRYEIRERRK
jgi:hypothetical protein